MGPTRPEHRRSKRFEKPVKWSEISRGCRIGFSPGWTGPEAGEVILEWLMEEVDWQQKNIRVRGREIPQPRLIAYFAKDTSLSYTYSGLKIVPQRLPPLLEELMEAVDQASGYPGYNSVLCNLYRDGGDCVGWHSDNEKLYGVDPTIGSLSFGEPRDFILRKNSDNSRTRTYPLGHGDLLIMSGATQRRWMHSVPKRMPASSCAPRVNLTFRRVVDPTARGTITPENSSSDEETEHGLTSHRGQQQQQHHRRGTPEQGSWRCRPAPAEEEQQNGGGQQGGSDGEVEVEVSEDEDERQGRWGHRSFRQLQRQQGRQSQQQRLQQQCARRQQQQQQQERDEEEEEEEEQQQRSGDQSRPQRWGDRPQQQQEDQRWGPRREQEDNRRPQDSRRAPISVTDGRSSDLHHPRSTSSNTAPPAWVSSSASLDSASAAARSALAGIGWRGGRGQGLERPADRDPEFPQSRSNQQAQSRGYDYTGSRAGQGTGYSTQSRPWQAPYTMQGPHRHASQQQEGRAGAACPGAAARPAAEWAPRSNARWNIDEEEEEEGDWEAESWEAEGQGQPRPTASAASGRRDGSSRGRPVLVLDTVVRSVAEAATQRSVESTGSQQAPLRVGTPPASGDRLTSASSARDGGAPLPPAAVSAGRSGSTSSRHGDGSGGSKPPSPVPGPGSGGRRQVRVPGIIHQILAGKSSPSLGPRASPKPPAVVSGSRDANSQCEE